MEQKLDPKMVAPGKYQHFKGNIYAILGASESAEKKGEFIVWLIPLAGPHAGKLTHRTLENFLEHVENHPDAPGYSGPRYKRMEAWEMKFDCNTVLWENVVARQRRFSEGRRA